MRSKPVAAAVIVLVLIIGGVSFIVYGWGPRQTVAAFLPAPYTISDPIIVHTKTTPGGTSVYWGSFPLQSQCGTISTGLAALNPAVPHVTLLFTVLEPAGGCDTPGTAAQDFSASYIPLAKNTKPVFEGVTVNGIIAKYTLVAEQ